MTMKGDPGLRLEHRVKLVKTSLNMFSRINTLGVFAAGAAYLGLSWAKAAMWRGLQRCPCGNFGIIGRLSAPFRACFIFTEAHRHSGQAA
jgi:hypothetical protein